MALSENKIVKNKIQEKNIDPLGLENKENLPSKDKDFCEKTIKECGEQMETMTEIITVYAKENENLNKKLKDYSEQINKIEKLEISNKLKTTAILVLSLIILISYYRNRN